MDFVRAQVNTTKKGVEVVPEFKAILSKDLMIRGGKFYAIWNEHTGLWSTSWYDAITLIDELLDEKAETVRATGVECTVKYLRDTKNCNIKYFKSFCEHDMVDHFVPLNSKIIFSNTKVKKTDYASFKLTYPIAKGDISSYDKLMNVLYDPEERDKFEWAIGCIIANEVHKVQKFIVLIGDAGTGKSTLLNIIRSLFEEKIDGVNQTYIATFDAKSLGNPNASFPLESFKNNPVVAIQEDGDLSKIKDNTKLNSLISHEYISVNTKYGSIYSQKFNTFLFIGSNAEVAITDSMSGLQRRLIDVRPSGNLVKFSEYEQLISQIIFERGAIAYHCLQSYKRDPGRYNRYRPVKSMRTTNIFFRFMEENLNEMSNGISLKRAYDMYLSYCEEYGYAYKMNKLQVQNELNGYFKTCTPYKRIEGNPVRNYYEDLKLEKFGIKNDVEVDTDSWLKFDAEYSVLDQLYSECPAQYANDEGSPLRKWENVTTKLKDINTTRLHWVKLPHEVIKIDFDLRDENGDKSLEANMKAASKFLPTYAEVSKSGKGIHLYYIWDGDEPVENLSRLYDENIEIKLSVGNMSHRRILTGCNKLQLSKINSGLPFKEKKKGGDLMVDPNIMNVEQGLITTIKRCINKEIHDDTTSNIDWIYEVLERAYNSGVSYDVSGMSDAVYKFALYSSHQKDHCLEKYAHMKFKSADKILEEAEKVKPVGKKHIRIFYDVEVYPNLFLLCWKQEDVDYVHKLFNPTPNEVAAFFNYEEKLGKFAFKEDSDYIYEIGGFNNRGYDDHICLKRIYGANNEELYLTSQAIINGYADAKLREGYHLSYFDVYDFSSKKQSLKKFEIELGIHHQEMGIPWDEPVPIEMWDKVAEYCANDVIATEAVFKARYNDYKVRELLADLSGLEVIDTNRQHITKIICGDEKYPDLVYTDLSSGVQFRVVRGGKDGKDVQSIPIGTPELDYTNSFPGYEFNPNGIPLERYTHEPASKNPKSIYKGEDPSEGGYVYAEPGMYSDVWCFDVAGMHPASLIALNKFGKRTIIFKEIRDARLAIKHKDYETAKKMLGGKLAKYLDNKEDAAALSGALKLILNSTYGIGAATFVNPLRDPTDADNIVAKRGACFMIELKQQVQAMGYQVVHCKTDSIKVVHPDQKIQDFIFEFGKKYGYEFEIEHKYEKFCLVNKAVYIAKNYIPNDDGELWEATGAQFAQPYVFKTLFTKEPLTFRDKCETKNVTTAMYLDMNEDLPEGEHNYIFVGRTGLFCPMKPGTNAGELLRKKDDKYSAVGGTKGFRWLEAEVVEHNHLEDFIDETYYRKLVDAAVDEISQYGDFEWFVSGDPNADEYEYRVA